MFLRALASPSDSMRPSDSKIAESDWEVLQRHWYPVCRIDEIGDAPLQARLLDIDLVVFRSGAEIAVAVDRCPHRYVRLSAGRVEDGNIVCPYHAMAFNGKGQCTEIPTAGVSLKIPKSYRLRTFSAVEKYGMVWCCLANEDQQAPFPELEALNDSGPDDLIFSLVKTWPCSAPRQIENFFDLAHVPIVHGHTIGANPTHQISPGKIVHDDSSVTMTTAHTEYPYGGEQRDSLWTFRIYLPFIIEMTLQYENGPKMRLYNIPAPVSAHECRVYAFWHDDGNLDGYREFVDGLDDINEEDIRILACTPPADLPLNQKFEIHLPSDNIASAYRKRLVEMGLGK